MKKTLFFFTTLGILFLTLLPTAQSDAAVSNWQKGVSVIPRWNTDFGSPSFKQSIRDLAATNANYVTLIVPWAQSNSYSTDVGGAWNTPTDDSLISGIQFVHSLGMKVNLKMHLDAHDGLWRAHINPGDRDGWFRSYGNMVKKYAGIASTHGVEQITIGAELINMSAHDANSTNTERWNRLIGEIRTMYGGKLTYSANWGNSGWTDEKNRIQFWPALDYIGISAYFPLPTGNATVEGFKAEWNKIQAGDVGPLSQRWGKPVIFTEVGYRSHDWAQYEPFNFWAGGNFSQENQANLYDALYAYWNDYGYMQGVHWWDWSSDPNAGGMGNTDYTPQNKLAESVMTRWQQGGALPPPPPPPPPGNASFETSAKIPTNGAVGQSITINTSIKNASGDSIFNILIDVEVYNESNARVFQQTFANQNFGGGETKSFQSGWTPNTAGNFTVKMGVFSNDWSRNYTWNDAAARITIGGGGQPPPPPPGSGNLNLWWPSDGSSLFGSQPFKTVVEGRTVEQYQMYWQVDGDRLNEMGESQVDYPHKEAVVDVGGWNWRQNGPYALTFTAKELSGGIIGQKNVNIFIAR